MGVEVSICGSAKRFFWCVCDEGHDRPLACGHAATLEDAEEQVWVQARIHRSGVRAEQVGDWLARRVRRNLWVRDRTRPTGEVLYTESPSEYTSGWGSVPHPVVRKTAKRVFVEGGVSGRLLALDRGPLEAEGRVWSGTARTYYYSQPYEVRCADRIAEQRLAEEREREGERRRIDGRATFTEDELRSAGEVARRAGIPGLDTLAVAEVLRFMNSLPPAGTPAAVAPTASTTT